MIAFNRDFEENKFNKEAKDKLQDLLDLVFFQDLSSKEDLLNYINDSKIDYSEDIDLSNLIDLVYDILFVENKKELKLIIKRQENNSLKLEVLNIK